MEERVILDTRHFLERNDLDKKLKPVFNKAVDGDCVSQFSIANQILEIVKDPSSKLYGLWLKEAAYNGCVMAQFLLSEDEVRTPEERFSYSEMLISNPDTSRQVYLYELEKLADRKYASDDLSCIGDYEKILSESSRSKKASYRLADLYLRKGEKKRARKMFALYRKIHKLTMDVLYEDPLSLKKRLKSASL